MKTATIIFAVLLSLLVRDSNAKKDNLKYCGGTSRLGAYIEKIVGEDCITYKVGRSASSDPIALCPAGCLKNGACDPNYDCGVGGSSLPIIIIAIGFILAIVYRFVSGCYLKPRREKKKLETDAFKAQTKAEMIT